MQEQIKIKPNGRVYLTLPDKSYKPVRQIGFLKDKTFCTYRNPENMYFKKIGGIGINYKLLSMGGSYFDKMRIEYGFEILETTREYYLEFGEFLHFSKNKLDKQLFLKLELFGMDQVEQWEATAKNRLENSKEEIIKTEVAYQEELF